MEPFIVGFDIEVLKCFPRGIDEELLRVLTVWGRFVVFRAD